MQKGYELQLKRCWELHNLFVHLKLWMWFFFNVLEYRISLRKIVIDLFSFYSMKYITVGFNIIFMPWNVLWELFRSFFDKTLYHCLMTKFSSTLLDTLFKGLIICNLGWYNFSLIDFTFHIKRNFIFMTLLYISYIAQMHFYDTPASKSLEVVNECFFLIL